MEPQQQSETPLATTPVPASKNQFLIPVAIILGFGMIAAAIFFGQQSSPSAQYALENTAPEENQVRPNDNGNPEDINPVTEEDWIRGNPNAPIQIVEYSDYDCPFCKNFHETMNQVMDEYGADGQVAWIFRHFPLQQLHPNAPAIAQAAECVGNLGGNESFWTFSDFVFDERSTNEPTDITRLEEFAVSSGVSAAAFNECVANNEYQENVEADFNNAIAVGGRGTPHSIVLVGDQQGVINGAQPYATVKQIVDNLISQIGPQG